MPTASRRPAPCRSRCSPVRATRTPRFASDSKGDDGNVTQSNSVASHATALNVNLTGQKAGQDQAGDCRCHSAGTQAIGQEARNDQSAAAASLAAQSGGRDKCGCGSSGNTNAPVRVDSYGGGGSVEQSNSVGSSAGAGNLNALYQGADQTVRLRWHAGDRPEGQERAGRAGPFGSAAVRRLEQEHPGARGQQG